MKHAFHVDFGCEFGCYINIVNNSEVWFVAKDNFNDSAIPDKSMTFVMYLLETSCTCWVLVQSSRWICTNNNIKAMLYTVVESSYAVWIVDRLASADKLLVINEAY